MNNADKRASEKSPDSEDTLILDPYGASFPRSPYVLVPQLTPSMPFSAVHDLMKQLQRSRQLGRENKAAFRAIRDVVARVVWDLLTLGTTPGISAGAWQDLSAELQLGHRDGVYRNWIPRTRDLMDGASALHVCAALSANDVAHDVEFDGKASEGSLSRFVAFWAALLLNKDWLRSFAIDRCKVWERNQPDAGDQAQLVDHIEKSVAELLQTGAGDDHHRRVRWFSHWDRETATIEAVQQACRNYSESEWTKGFGPLGISQLDEAKKTREVLLKMARAYKGGLAINAVKTGAAGLMDANLERAGEAAVTLQLLFSGLGEVAANVWNGDGRTAAVMLEDLRTANEDLAVDPWFGSTSGSRIRRERAYLDLKSEALLLRFQDELRQELVTISEIGTTASLVLRLADSVRKPSLLIAKLEDLLIGRLTACTEKSRLPPPREIQRVLEAAQEVRQQLLAYGAGNRCALPIAKLLDRRATYRWNRSSQMPKPNIQLNLLRDVMQAVELAPHNPDIVENMVSLVVQIQIDSGAERKNRLDIAQACVDRAIASVGSTVELEKARFKLLEHSDPEEARRQTQARLYEARRSSKK